MSDWRLDDSRIISSSVLSCLSFRLASPYFRCSHTDNAFPPRADRIPPEAAQRRVAPRQTLNCTRTRNVGAGEDTRNVECGEVETCVEMGTTCSLVVRCFLFFFFSFSLFGVHRLLTVCVS